MTTRYTWRRALAVPAALSLALGGALFGATTASAAPGDLTVSTPEQGATLASRVVEVVGTAPAGNIVVVSESTTDVPFETVTVDATGTFSITVPYDDTIDPSQALDITSTVPGADTFEDIITRDFVLPVGTTTPPVDPEVEFAVTAPEPGTPLESRTVTFSGTGTDGSTVTATDAADLVLGGPAAVTDGAWTLDAVFAVDATVDQTVTFTQLTEGVATGSVEVTLTLPTGDAIPEPTPIPEPLPTPVLDAPVFTAPVQGEVVVGDRVTFQGTGTPGADIIVLSVPTAQLEELQAEFEAALAAMEPQMSTLAQPAPQPEPVDPTDRIVVGDDGTWSVTVNTVPGEYTAAAVSVLLDEDEQPVFDENGLPVVSAPSADLEYSVVAAVVPAGTTPVVVTPTHAALAHTGSELSGTALGLGGALALAGVALTLVARRRRALEAVTAAE